MSIIISAIKRAIPITGKKYYDKLRTLLEEHEK